MKPVERRVYFEDVKLQMDSKLWGELYNNCDPPKKVIYAIDAPLETSLVDPTDKLKVWLVDPQVCSQVSSWLSCNSEVTCIAARLKYGGMVMEGIMSVSGTSKTRDY